MTDQKNHVKDILARVKTAEDMEAVETILESYETDPYRKDLPAWLPEFAKGRGSDSKTALAELKTALGRMKWLRLGIAFHPTEEFTADIGEWMKRSVGYDVVLELQYDHTITGGIKVYFEGKYYDGNLSSTVDRILEEHKERIAKSLFAEHGK